MPRVVNIREYEYINDPQFNAESKNAVGTYYLDPDSFKELENFINKTRLMYNDKPIFVRSYSSEHGVSYRAEGYVGTIRLSTGVVIQIWPKIIGDKYNNTDQELENKIFSNMLSVVMNVSPYSLYSTCHRLEHLSPFDVFIRLFVSNVSNLAKRGLKGGYERVNNNEHFYKGKLLVASNIHKNAAHAERFYVSYDKFTLNRPENRLIKTTLQRLRNLTASHTLRHSIDLVLQYFEDVSYTSDIDADFKAVNIDRSMSLYTSVLDWCKLFLKGQSFTPFTGKRKTTSLLFPMDTLFEECVARLVKREALKLGWNCTSQEHAKLFADHTCEEEINGQGSGALFDIYPDIVLRPPATAKNTQPVILDTKWKRITLYKSDIDKNRKRGAYSIEREDRFQITSYHFRYQAQRSVLVYPLYTKINPNFQAEDVCNAYVHARFINSDGFAGADQSVHAHTEIDTFVFDLAHPQESAQRLLALVANAQV